ncbi:MAG: hypothetical protein HYW56_01980 [Candidatus Harrisonbacteria bacterium]|nr:hypothetical protein [Candidatus Harrisonbacteria bacterium]
MRWKMNAARKEQPEPSASEQTLAVLRDRWRDPEAATKDPIVVHHVRIDVDELGAFYMFFYAFFWRIADVALAYQAIGKGIEKFIAGEKSPGIQFLPWGLGGTLADGRTAEEWTTKNVFWVGIGGGKLDEHTPSGRIENQCAATLAAKELGIAGNPVLEKLLKYLYQCDITPSGGLDSVAGAVKRMSRRDGSMGFRDVMKWAFAHFETIIDDETQRVAVTPVEYEGNAKTVTVRGPHGRDIRVTLVEPCSNPQVATYGFGKGDAIVVLKSPHGNVSIQWNRNILGFPKLVDLVVALRGEEAKLAGGRMYSQEELASTGSVLGWFYPPFSEDQRKFVANGTLTSPDVPPTKIPIERIMEIIGLVWNQERWAPGFAVHCKAGVCAHKGPEMCMHPCPFFALQLPRCTSVQRGERHVASRQMPPVPSAAMRQVPIAKQAVEPPAMQPQAPAPPVALNTTPSV